MNEVLKSIEERSSIRKYKEEMITEEQLNTLIQAALQAPTARNEQEIDVTVLKRGSKALKVLEDGFNANRETPFNFYYNAPVLFVLSGKKNFRFAQVDAGIAVESMTLAAQSMGLGSVILGIIYSLFDGPDGDKYRAALELKEGYDFMIALAVGYKDTEKVQHTFDLNKNVKFVD